MSGDGHRLDARRYSRWAGIGGGASELNASPSGEASVPME
jgi:hypothetical protein